MGGGVYIRLVVGYTWTWASLDFRNRVSMHGIDQLVNDGGLRGIGSRVPSTKVWPRPSPQNNSSARGCAGQCKLRKGSTRRMLPSPLHHPPPVPLTGRSPPPCGGGRRGGLGTAPGCWQQDRGGNAGRRAVTRCAGTWSQKAIKKGLRVVRKRNTGERGNSREIRTKFVRIS